MSEGGFDWKITLRKFLEGLGFALATAAIAYTIDFLEVTEFPPEYAIWTGCIIAFLRALQNYLKHRNDGEDSDEDEGEGSS